MADTEMYCQAFLLTRQWRDSAKGIVLDFWFASDAGPLHVFIENQQAIFFIRQSDTQSVTAALSRIDDVQIRPLKLLDFEHQPVAGVYFTAQQSLYQAREQLQQLDIRHYEADIRPVERYLTERFINAPVNIHIPAAQQAAWQKSSATLLLNPLLKSPQESPQKSPQANYKPNLKVMSLDIETAWDSQALYSIAMLCADWQVVLMKDNAQQTEPENNGDIEYFSSEKALMLRFIELMLQQDPDIIIGWNVVNFDFRFLQRKADSLKISLAIGRAESLPVWRKAQTEQRHYFLLIPGRVVLDGIDTLKSATWNFASFSLEAVGRELLGRGKLITPQSPAEQREKYDPLSSAREIKRLFYDDQQALAAYNLEDCQLVMDIFEHTELLAFAIERASLTGLEMDRNGGSVAAFDNQYLPRLHRKGFVAPNINDYQDSLSAPGGYVMNSSPGLYDSVLVLDYKSLYPSIIRTFRVDPYAGVKAQELEEKDCVPGFNGIRFARDDVILPEIIKSLWQARDRAKKDNNKALSQAIKIIMNSFYGVLGTPGCRVHDARLTSSITLRGHELMKQTAAMITTAGYEVIYGDTDSIFVSLGGKQEQQAADKIGRTLVADINQYWQKTLQAQYQIESFLEMEYETHYVRFFMPTIRGSDKGSKKRYAGMIDDPGKNTRRLVFKGLETVRTDWTALARAVQQELYQRIFYEQPYEDYLKDIVSRLKLGEFDEQLVYRKRLRQKLSDYTKNRPPHAQAALKVQQYAEHQANRYEFGGWIEYVITIAGPEPVEFNTQPLDYQHYIEKQIAPAVDSLLNVFDKSLEKILDNQYELF